MSRSVAGASASALLKRIAQVFAALCRRVAAPMAYDVSIRTDDQRLRNHIPPIHQHGRCLAVGPAEAEPEIQVAHKFLHPFRRRARIFSRKPDELYSPPGKLLADVLVLRNFPAARAAPRRPDINHDDLATKVRETEAAIVQR